jgi:hypothetical protein
MTRRNALKPAVGNSPYFLNESPTDLDNVITAVGNSPRSFQTFAAKSQPEFVVDSFEELYEMSAWLGQRYHHFDEISLLFETTQQSLGPRNVV